MVVGHKQYLFPGIRAVAVVPEEVRHLMYRETEVQRGIVSGLRPHSKSAAALGPEPRPLASQGVCPRLGDTPH